MRIKVGENLQSDGLLKIIVFLLFAYAIIERVVFYNQFQVAYTDEDQCIQWLAADQLLKGIIREPCFFGQAYNTCLEGWLAAPFVAAGMEFYYAIPLVTSLLSFIPFALLAFHYWRNEKFIPAVLVMFCMLIFSLDYKLISLLPRGFIPGVFGFGLGYYFLLKRGRYSFFWFSFFALFGFALNEMSFFLTFPVYLLLLKEKYKTPGFYIQSVLGAILPLVYKVYAYVFYNKLHPGYNYFVKPTVQWKYENLQEAIRHVDRWWFGDFTSILLIVIGLIALVVYTKKYYAGLVLLLTMLLVLVSLGLDRMQDGSESILFHRSRLYLFIPLLCAVFAGIITEGLDPALKVKNSFSLVLFLLVGVHVGMQQLHLQDKIKKEVAIPEKVVAFISVDDLIRNVNIYKAVCRASGNDFIFYDGLKKEDFIHYTAVPVLTDGEIKTFLPSYDRRTWVLEEYLPQKPAKFIAAGNWPDRFHKSELSKYKRRILMEGNFWFVEYELQKNIEATCLEDFGIPLRVH